jgi:hypothetical protein
MNAKNVIFKSQDGQSVAILNAFCHRGNEFMILKHFPVASDNKKSDRLAKCNPIVL